MRYAFVNLKGGVGKTTSTVNTAAFLAHAGKRVLIIDLDRQSHASKWIGQDDYAGPSSADVLEGRTSLIDAIVASRVANIDLVPANAFLALTDFQLQANSMKRPPGTVLRDALTAVDHRYDFILFDCAPALSPVTANAILAADRIVVPIKPEYLSLDGTVELHENAHQMLSAHEPKRTPIIRHLITQYDGMMADHRSDTKELKLSAHCYLRNIRKSPKLMRCPLLKQTILDYAPDSTGADDYEIFAQELLEEARTSGQGSELALA